MQERNDQEEIGCAWIQQIRRAAHILVAVIDREQKMIPGRQQRRCGKRDDRQQQPAEIPAHPVLAAQPLLSEIKPAEADESAQDHVDDINRPVRSSHQRSAAAFHKRPGNIHDQNCNQFHGQPFKGQVGCLLVDVGSCLVIDHAEDQYAEQIDLRIDGQIHAAPFWIILISL